MDFNNHQGYMKDPQRTVMHTLIFQNQECAGEG